MTKDEGTGMSLWDTLAPQYDHWYDTPLGAYALQAEVEALVELGGDLADSRGLEVGCGTGRFSHAFAQRGARMTGIDLSRAMLDVGKKTTAGSLCQADGKGLPFRGSSFEFVLAVTLLEFVQEPDEVLDEMWRVLRPGGRLLVGALNAWSLWAMDRRRRGQEPFDRASFFSPRDFEVLLARYGSVTWRGAVFIPSAANARNLALWRVLESVGSSIAPWFGAFLAGYVRKQPGG